MISDMHALVLLSLASLLEQRLPLPLEVTDSTKKRPGQEVRKKEEGVLGQCYDLRRNISQVLFGTVKSTY